MSYPSVHRCLLGTIYSSLHDKQIHTLLRQKENKHLPFLPFLLRLNYPNRLFGTFCAGFVEATFPFCRHFFFTAYRTTRWTSWATSDLGTPGMSFFTPPPYRDITGVCYTVRSDRDILLCIPFIQNTLPIVFFAITFQAHFSSSPLAKTPYYAKVIYRPYVLTAVLARISKRTRETELLCNNNWGDILLVFYSLFRHSSNFCCKE